MTASHLNPSAFLRDHVLQSLSREPIDKQIEILTALAAVEKSEVVAKSMRRMADELRLIERNQRQLVLDLRSSAHSTA